MLGYVQWLMDYLVFVVRELLLVAKDLRQKHYESYPLGCSPDEQKRPMSPVRHR